MKPYRLAVVALLVAAAPLSAKSSEPPAIIVDPALVLPPPPAAGSVQSAAELAELEAMDRSRTPEMLAAARADSATKNATIFAAAIGPGFDLDRLPRTAALMKIVRATEKDAADRGKTLFARNRPWVVAPALHHCGKDDDADRTSYPSGHTTMGYSMAVVLARLLPMHAPAIMARAASYAQNRIVCEVHFRSDVAAGEALGTVVAERLLADPGFRARFEEARAELAGAGLR